MKNIYEGKSTKVRVGSIPHVRASKRTDYQSICQVLPSAIRAARREIDSPFLQKRFVLIFGPGS